MEGIFLKNRGVFALMVKDILINVFTLED